ncbi:hypothetical protein [Clostridium polynesiense]|uniref:hypothetical protein n=1 Tax=Clostridium polynesiense TaxID=1325933 RepID=UPI000A9957B7|nr:hypothetical protein [Clostridium polynesiense]
MEEKVLLADVIYQFHKKYSFYGKSKTWSNPIALFSASKDKTISQKVPEFIKSLENTKILREDIEDIICILGDWDHVAEGIIFTSKAMYVNSPKNRPKKFRIRYDDIIKFKHYTALKELEITDYYEKTYCLNTKLWNAGTIKKFLEFSSAQYNYSNDEREEISNIKLPSFDNRRIGDIIAGMIYGNVSNASTIYGEDKFNTPRGHGFAAERANHLYDTIKGRNSKIVGDDNVKNGADRTVDGVNIQSKYCSSGSKCISECFENGKFRYVNTDGTPMQIEVPSDKYDAAISAMRDRISKGEVPGVSNPEEANNIVRKGNYTYVQVKNIAKAGTIESLKYDAKNGMIIASSTTGITAIISFATSVWNGESLDVALKNAAFNGLKVGGSTFITAVLAGQLSKAGLNSLLVGSSEAIIKVLGPKGSAVLVNAFRSGKNIYGGAAMKSAAKMLRGNAITGAVSIVVLSTGDIANIFRSRISGAQLFKNVTNTVSSVAGGTAGWVGGATAGAAIGSVVPIIGNAVGGIAGGIIGAFGGGAVASEISDTVLSAFIEDDAVKMTKIIEETFSAMADNYLLTKKEVEHIIDHLGESLTAGKLKDMFASEDRAAFSVKLLLPYFEREIKRRKKIYLLNQESLQRGLRLLLEEMSNNGESLIFE